MESKKAIKETWFISNLDHSEYKYFSNVDIIVISNSSHCA